MTPARCDVLGTPISLIDHRELLEVIRRPPADRALVVAVCNVHSVMSARRDGGLAEVLHKADVSTPDGVPLVWAIRLLHGFDQSRVAGPDFMAWLLLGGEGNDLQHFFYGSTQSTLTRLERQVIEVNPRVRIAGSYSPPFRSLSESELDEHARHIRETGADVVWVGLGMPKQERWMGQMVDRLPGVSLIGVGAAFELLAGVIPRAPEWMQRRGLEWAFRLSQEPRRLWKRYVWNNPAFLVLLGGRLVQSRLRSLLLKQSAG